MIYTIQQQIEGHWVQADYNMDVQEDIARYVHWHQHVWPGGYEMYAVCDDGEALCHGCCGEEISEIRRSDPGDGWHLTGIGTTEGEESHLTCGHCIRTIYLPETDANVKLRCAAEPGENHLVVSGWTYDDKRGLVFHPPMGLDVGGTRYSFQSNDLTIHAMRPGDSAELQATTEKWVNNNLSQPAKPSELVQGLEYELEGCQRAKERLIAEVFSFCGQYLAGKDNIPVNREAAMRPLLSALAFVQADVDRLERRYNHGEWAAAGVRQYIKDQEAHAKG